MIEGALVFRVARAGELAQMTGQGACLAFQERGKFVFQLGEDFVRAIQEPAV